MSDRYTEWSLQTSSRPEGVYQRKLLKSTSSSGWMKLEHHHKRQVFIGIVIAIPVALRTRLELPVSGIVGS